MGRIVLDYWDKLSNQWGMQTSSLTWKLVDETAAKIGAPEAARLKWRQRRVPFSWRIKIADALAAEKVAVDFADFDRLEKTPGSIAA